MQQLSMGHMPDPATDSTLENGITIHYTTVRYGSVEFAVLEARKFKNRYTFHSLLGDDQEVWLQDWCDSTPTRIKIILTQTPFGSLATNETNTYKLPNGMYPMGNNIDANAYPVDGRTTFMKIIEGCSSLVLSGDQHLGIAVTYDEYQVSECASPAVINDVWWRLNLRELGNSYQDDFGHQCKSVTE
jgi:phosphodiesterase/alkaline phosphatase D-like protein